MPPPWPKAAANKPLTFRVVRRLNRELGITMTAAEIQALLDAVYNLPP